MTEPTTTPTATTTTATSAPVDAVTPPAEGDAAPPQPSALEKAKAAADKARAQAAKRREQAAQFAKVQAENERLAAAVRQAQERDERLRKDRDAAAKEYGIDDKYLAQRKLDLSTPEGQLRMLQEQVAVERAEREKLQKTIEGREHAARLKAAEESFIRAAQSGESYPTLAQQNPQFVLLIAKHVAAEAYRRTNTSYEDAEILSYLEKNWRSATASAAASKEPSATAATATTETPASPRTISNAAASNRLEVPADFSKLSDREQRRHLAEVVKRATKK